MFGFINKDDKQGLVYSGEIAVIDYTMEQLEALTWSKPSNVTMNKVSVNAYGREHLVTLPVYEEINDSHKDRNDDFKKYIFSQARYKMITDKVLGVRVQILKQYNVYQHGASPFIGFYPTDETQKTAAKLDRYSGKEKAGLIMLKELLDGDIRLEPYKLIHKGTEKLIEIGTNYKIKLFDDDVCIP